MDLTLPIFETAKKYELVCAAMGIPAMTLDQFAIFPENQRQHHFSNHKIITAIEFLMQGRVLDYENTSQYKHFPWFQNVPGRGWVFDDVIFGIASTAVGARHSMDEDELVRFITAHYDADYQVIMGA